MKNKKKLIVRIILFSILVFFIGFFTYKEFNAYPDLSETDSIYIFNGNNGDNMEITNESDIEKVLEYMNNMNYIYMPSLPRGGYSYALTFYNKGEQNKKYIYSDNSMKIDGVNYKVFNGNDITMDELFQSLSISAFETLEE